MFSTIRGAITEEYLLLTREEGPLRQIEDLKGRSLNISSDVRCCLASFWLELLCREHGFNSAAQALGKIAFSEKASQVILPVFFGKADAGLVTRNAYEVACELNPQLKKQLRVVAVSPPLVPALSCFRRGLSETDKEKIIKAAELSSTKPAFQQIMILFKSDGVSHGSMAALDDTRAFMAQVRKLGIGAPTAATREQATAVLRKEVSK